MDAEAWNRRYSTEEFVWRTEPNRFLPPEVAGLAAGRALDLACGEGRNAVWLATRGWRVTGVDFAEVGLDKARRLAAEHGVEVTWVRADVTAWTAPEPADLVLVFYVQLPEEPRRHALARAAAAVAPGGTLLVVAHDLANLTEGHGGPQDPAVLYTPGDVVADLAGSGLEVQRAERVRRPVELETGVAHAVDCLVRAWRPEPSG
jgi:SAM-dependent methyltransferase